MRSFLSDITKLVASEETNNVGVNNPDMIIIFMKIVKLVA